MVVETDPVDFANLETEIKTLLKLAEMDDEAGLLRKLTALVPGYVNGQSPANAEWQEPKAYEGTRVRRYL